MFINHSKDNKLDQLCLRNHDLTDIRPYIFHKYITELRTVDLVGSKLTLRQIRLLLNMVATRDCKLATLYLSFISTIGLPPDLVTKAGGKLDRLVLG